MVLLILELNIDPVFMSSLSPPPSPGRHRASSTGRRPPLTLKTCSSRKRASSVSSVTAVQPPTPITLVAPQAAASILKSPKHAFNASSMLPVFLSRSLQLLDIPNHHAKAPSTSYSDDSILPLSASPTSTTFGDIFVEKSAFPSGFPSVYFLTTFARVLQVYPSPRFMHLSYWS